MRFLKPVIYISFLSFLVLAPSKPLFAVEFPEQDILVDIPLTAIPNNTANPDMSADSKGNVYVVWEDMRGGPGTIFFNHRFPDENWEPQSIAVTNGNPRDTDVEQGDAAIPRICSDENGHIYVVWVDNRAVKAGTGLLDIYFRYSKDFGASWLPEFNDYRIDTDTAVTGTRAGNSIDPQIACDDIGHVYIVWSDNRNSSGNYDVYFRSLFIDFDAPGNPITPLQFPDFRLNIGEENKAVQGGSFNTLTPQIAANGRGTVYITWEDTRENPSEEIFPGIYFNRSSNDGGTWLANDMRIDHRTLGFFRSYAPRIAADNSTGVHIIWLDTGPRPLQSIETAGRPKLFYNSSLNSGNSWLSEDKIISYVSRVVTVSEASISVNNRRGVYVAWTDDRGDTQPSDTTQTTQNGGGNFNVFFNHSENYGSTWLEFGDTVKQISGNIRLDLGNTDSNPLNPRIVSDDGRNVFVTWQDSRSGVFDIFMNLSPDSGRKGTWQDAEFRVDAPSSSGNSTNSRLLTDNFGRIHAVWADDRRVAGRFDIFYNGITFDIRTLSKGPRIGETCFIATAAYGSPWEPQVILLRQFRDSYLLSHTGGRKLVDFYYQYSPPAARFLDQHPEYKPAARIFLIPFVGIAALFVMTSLTQKLLILFLLLSLGVGSILWRKTLPFRNTGQG